MTRRFRRTSAVSLSAPPLVTIAIVAINRLTNGGLAFFGNGAPWTHWFWGALTALFFAGAILALATVGRRCPRCGNGLFAKATFRQTRRSASSRGGVNVLARQCVNCGLSLAGAKVGGD